MDTESDFGAIALGCWANVPAAQAKTKVPIIMIRLHFIISPSPKRGGQPHWTRSGYQNPVCVRTAFIPKSQSFVIRA
ncbi:MAG TPA: hypothetical protein VHN81_09110 [Edaphobacter sp.]|nr:hypothetical protein [Edaphobacter sp.]